MSNNKGIISSHIFIFPFRWDVVKNENCLNTCIDDRLKVNKFIECLRNGWEVDPNITNIIDKKEVENNLDYNTYAYFYSNVKEAIYGKYINHVNYSNKKEFNKIVNCFNYKNIGENPIYEIHVQKRDDKGEITVDESYKLKIEHIKLKVYDTGVATLSYFLGNYEWKDKEDILRINDYGRRIYPQYIPLDDIQDSFLAKKLSLIKVQDEPIEEFFMYESNSDDKDKLSKNKPTRISKTIMNILGNKFISTEKELQEKCSRKEENIFVRPVIDDRMFVICYYNDNTSSRILTNLDKDEYLKNDFWYQFLFIDNGGATCKDKKMKEELLSKSTYTRWKDCGTLFGISRYSFVLLCDESGFSKKVLYNHVNNIYYEMIVLALVQRASILRFSDETSRIASFESKNMYQQIKKLQEYYIRFVNTIYFREVTAQEQGIELYDKLTELMRIEKEVKRLDEEIGEIQRYITLETNENTNEFINLITYVGLSVSVMGLVATAFGSKPEKLWCLGISGAFTLMIIWIIKDRR